MTVEVASAELSTVTLAVAAPSTVRSASATAATLSALRLGRAAGQGWGRAAKSPGVGRPALLRRGGARAAAPMRAWTCIPLDCWTLWSRSAVRVEVLGGCMPVGLWRSASPAHTKTKSEINRPSTGGQWTPQSLPWGRWQRAEGSAWSVGCCASPCSDCWAISAVYHTQNCKPCLIPVEWRSGARLQLIKVCSRSRPSFDLHQWRP